MGDRLPPWLFWPYGIYTWLVFLAVALPLILVLLLMPTLEIRRRVTRIAARLIFILCGIRVKVQGLDRIPPSTSVVVANHASYLDGVLMMAVLPTNFGFVVKQEVRAFLPAHVLLRRIGTHFVERFNRHRGAMDARRILRAAHQGHALAFFPEGTFEREPGLRSFQSGAFATAVRADLPLIPVVIRGARAILPSGRLLPRPGRLEVLVGEALLPDKDCENPVRQLRDLARAHILQELGEPDLGQSRRRKKAVSLSVP